MWTSMVYGADSSAGVFRESETIHALEQGKYIVSPSKPLPGSDKYIPYFVEGDDAFAVRRWMMKPPSKREMTATEPNLN